MYTHLIRPSTEDLGQVFSKLHLANLTLNMAKCHFLQPSLKFLGHVVSGEGTAADPEKVEATQQYPIPTNLKAVKRFLGLAGWYHKFIPHFADLAAPRKKECLGNGQRTARTAQSSERMPCKLLLGCHPDLNKPFRVYTDASEVGLGAILAQSVEDN